MSIDITAESITSTRPDSWKEEEEEEEKLAVNRASCALDAVYAKVQKYLVVHRDRSPPSPPSSLLVVSFGQSHFTSKHAQVTREKLSICFWSRLFVQNRWRHFGHVVTSRTWWRREMTYAFCAREIERILQVCACGGGICLCVWTKWQAYVRKKTGTDFLF